MLQEPKVSDWTSVLPTVQPWAEAQVIDPLWRIETGTQSAVHLWHSDTDTNPLASSIDSVTRELSIDSTALDSLLATIEVDVPGSGTTVANSLPWPARGGRGNGSALVMVLVAEPGDGIYGHGEDTALGTVESPYWLAVHAVSGAGVLLAKAIGRAVGLVDEGTDVDRIPYFDRWRYGPNIGRGSVASDSTHPGFLWRHLAGSGYTGPHEGGQGAPTGVYRYAEHCIMRLPVGRPEDVDTADATGYCLACEAWLNAHLAPVATGDWHDRQNPRDSAQCLGRGGVHNNRDARGPERAVMQYCGWGDGFEEAMVARMTESTCSRDGRCGWAISARTWSRSPREGTCPFNHPDQREFEPRARTS